MEGTNSEFWADMSGPKINKNLKNLQFQHLSALFLHEPKQNKKKRQNNASFRTTNTK